MSLAERFTGLSWKDNGPIALIGLGHGATHWTAIVVFILLPAIREDLGLSYAEVGILLSIFQFSSFLANFFSGPLVDVTGQRVLFQVLALALGGAALALFGITGGFMALAGLIIVIGATNNLWHPPAIAFLSSMFPSNRGYALSIHGLGANLGDAVGPIVAGLLLAAGTWQSAAAGSAIPVFVVAGLIGICLFRFDKKGAPSAVKGMGVAGFFLGLREVITNRDVVNLCVMSGFRSMTQAGLLMFLPLYLADVMKMSPLYMGIAMTAMQVGGVIASPVAGVMSDRIGRRPVVLAGLTGSTVIVASLTFLGNEAAFVAGIAALGFALYAVRPVVHSWMMDLTPPHMGGSASSMMFATQSGFSVAMPLIAGALADTYGLVSVFYFLAVGMLITNLLTLRLPKDRPAAG